MNILKMKIKIIYMDHKWRKHAKEIPIEIGLDGDIYTEIKTDINAFTIVLPDNGEIELTDNMVVNINEIK